MFTLYKKELNYYLNNPIGHIVVILFAVFANFMYVKDIFVVGSASMRPFFDLLPWLMMIFVPALAMRALSEEKRANTIEALLTLPLSESQIVTAKFLALLTMTALGLALTVGLPVSLSFLTKLYLPEILVGYLGAVLMAGLFLSIAIFFSSQTKNQVVALLASIVVIFVLNVVNTDIVGSVLPKFIQDITVYLSPIYHLQSFAKGLIDLRSLFYFLSGISVFLFLTVVDLEKRG
jgi:ABC-2 type transport system permease protein